jgi:Cys-tRNA(Pro) deacylase
MSRGLDIVRSFIDTHGVEAKIVEFKTTTKTSQLAADALNCIVAQIGKSIVFTNGSPVVVVISGDERIDVEKLSKLIGGKVKKANAMTVKEETGYTIGGVPPFPLPKNVVTLIDASVERFEEVWVAAGTPNAVMKIKVDDLKKITKANIVKVKQI